MSTAVDVRNWQAYAVCRGVKLFYKSDLDEREPRHWITRAKAVCVRCPVRPYCAAHALAAAEPYGIWGGFTESERALLLGTDWRECADRRGTMVDVGRLQARIRKARSAARVPGDG
jgi:WhiB family redox-sensing transcriptional regulator